MGHIRMEVEEHIAMIVIEHPPANTLSQAVLNELEQLFAKIEQQKEIRVVLLRGEGRFFAAGADIKEFTEVKSGRTFTEMALKAQAFFY